MRTETIQGTEWCKEICPYRDGKTCKEFGGADCYPENNRKHFNDS